MISEISFDDRKYLYSEEMKNLGIKNGFTFRLGGCSDSDVEGLNLGFRVGDKREDVIKNYEMVSKDLGLDFNSIVLAKQAHTDNIKVVTKEDMGKGLTKISDITDIDGLVTGEKNIPLVVFSADCYPVLLADKEKKAVAAVHSGWRGTYLEIIKKAVSVMIEEFDVNPENIIAAIGAGIGKCCFEVESDVASYFNKRYVQDKNNGKFFVDLQGVINKSLLESGLLKDNIYFSNRCTVCESDKFYSYRVHRNKTGRMGAFISI